MEDALWRSPACSGARTWPGGAIASSSSSSNARRTFRISARPRGVSGGGGGGFSDEGHLKYYVSPARCGRSKKEEKRRAKLVKRLARDLPVFYSMGVGQESSQELAGKVKGKMFSEAAELLLAPLKQQQAQEKEMKRQRKEKATKKAAKMKDYNNSSSSSESSDSECEAVVKMSSLRTAIIAEPAAPTCNSAPLPLQLGKTGDGMEENNSRFNLGLECISTTSRRASYGCSSNGTPVVEKPMDKIEVCMGGRCKKSGALQLLEEFKRKIGIEGAVVPCKCMGKCNNGPNVRVVKRYTEEEDYVKDAKHPLFMGIGLDDVDTVVTTFFGEKKDALIS